MYVELQPQPREKYLSVRQTGSIERKRKKLMHTMLYHMMGGGSDVSSFSLCDMVFDIVCGKDDKLTFKTFYVQVQNSDFQVFQGNAGASKRGPRPQSS